MYHGTIYSNSREFDVLGKVSVAHKLSKEHPLQKKIQLFCTKGLCFMH